MLVAHHHLNKWNLKEYRFTATTFETISSSDKDRKCKVVTHANNHRGHALKRTMQIRFCEAVASVRFLLWPPLALQPTALSTQMPYEFTVHTSLFRKPKCSMINTTVVALHLLTLVLSKVNGNMKKSKSYKHWHQGGV